MDSNVQITLIICIMIIIVYFMSLFKKDRSQDIEISKGPDIINIRPPRTGSGIKSSSTLEISQVDE